MASADSGGFLHWEAIPVLVTRHARLLLVVIAIITGLSILQLVDIETGELKLRIDPSVERLLSPDDEAYRYYQSARRIFGSDETILLLLETDDVFSANNMEIISRLTRRLEKVDGIVRVVSLSNALNIRGSEFGIDIESWADMAAAHSGAAANIPRTHPVEPDVCGHTGRLARQCNRHPAVARRYHGLCIPQPGRA